MIRAFTDYRLDNQNTFGIKAKTKYYFEFTETDDLIGFVSKNTEWHTLPLLILGEGSNILFVSDFEGLTIHPNIPGIGIAREDRNNIWIEAGAGVIWDDLVEYVVQNQWGGIENLSLIPGNVGASAVQNIGAYGMEVQNRIESISGFDLETRKIYSLGSNECQFAYRDSIFKNNLKNRLIITHVIFKLDKFPEFCLDYGALRSELEKNGEVNLRNIRKTVIALRESKLPDPKLLGNAGSFFKNPIVEPLIFDRLNKQYPNLPHYPSIDGRNKLAAGWLIEQCGWKCFRRGDAGVHDKQALVLVNHGNAAGKEIFYLSEEIRQSVIEKFGVTLEREVNVIGNLS